MAYKEFRNEKLYDAPEIETTGIKQGLGAVTDAVVAKKNVAAKKESDKLAKKEAYKFDAKAAKFTSDVKIAAEVVKNEVIPTAYRNISETGSTGEETRVAELKAATIVEESDSQYQHFTDLQRRITDKKADPYYIPDADANDVFESAYGKEGEDVNHTNRGARLKQTETKLFGLRTFNQPKLIADYVAQEPVEEAGTEYSNEKSTGVTNSGSKTYKGKFIHVNAKGVGYINVTPADVDEYFKFDPEQRVEKFYSEKAGAEVDERISKDKSLSPEIAAITDPVAKRNAYIVEKGIHVGARAREIAKKDLEDKAYINALTRTGVKIDHVRAEKVEAEKVEVSNATTPLAITYSEVSYRPAVDAQGKPVLDSKGRPMTEKVITPKTNNLPVFGQSLMKGKPGDAKPLEIKGLNLTGGKRLNSDPGSEDNSLKNHNFTDAQIFGTGIAFTLNGKDIGSDKRFRTTAEMKEHVKKVLASLTPEERAKVEVRRVVYGKTIDKVKVKGDGDGSERKKVDSGKKDKGGQPIFEYEDQYEQKEVPFVMDVNDQVEEALKKATNNKYSSANPSGDEKEMLELARKNNIKIRDAKGVKGGNKNQHTEPAKRVEAAKEKQKEVAKQISFNEFVASFERKELGGKRKATANEISQLKPMYENLRK